MLNGDGQPGICTGLQPLPPVVRHHAPPRQRSAPRQRPLQHSGVRPRSFCHAHTPPTQSHPNTRARAAEARTTYPERHPAPATQRCCDRLLLHCRQPACKATLRFVWPFKKSFEFSTHLIRAHRVHQVLEFLII